MIIFGIGLGLGLVIAGAIGGGLGIFAGFACILVFTVAAEIMEGKSL